MTDGLRTAAIRRRFQAAFPAGIGVGSPLSMTVERIEALNDVEDLLASLAEHDQARYFVYEWGIWTTDPDQPTEGAGHD